MFMRERDELIALKQRDKGVEKREVKKKYVYGKEKKKKREKKRKERKRKGNKDMMRGESS
jgi:hypothetical protein